jgi:hypothetical protein
VVVSTFQAPYPDVLHSRWSDSVDKRMSDDAWLSIGDITAVTIGRSTRVLQKNSGKDKDASTYVSIVTADRSLDMQAWMAFLSV